MQSLKKLALAGLLIGTSALAAAPQANAAQLIWTFRSITPETTYIRFYSQDRDAQWPSTSWILDDKDFHTFTLNCNYGESISYGAWDDNNTWGAGSDNSSCEKCAAICGGDPPVMTLR